jgi:hypothetical protein
MSGWSKGPWEVDPKYPRDVLAGDELVATAYCMDGINGMDSGAVAGQRNARLIATSPVLYDALSGLLGEVEGALGMEENALRGLLGNTNLACLKRRVEQARAALAKAKEAA